MVQGYIMIETMFFVDMINNRIETGTLISEILKCNTDLPFNYSREEMTK